MDKPFAKYDVPSMLCYTIIVGILLSINALPILDMFGSNTITNTYGTFNQAFAQRQYRPYEPGPDGLGGNRPEFTRSTGQGYSISFPSDGQVQDIPGGVVLQHGPLATSVITQSNVRMSLEQWTDQIIGMASKSLDNFQLVDNQIKQSSTSGFPDEYYYFTGDYQGQQMTCTNVDLIAQGNGYWHQTCIPSQILQESSSTIDYIVNSFEIVGTSYPDDINRPGRAYD